MKIKIAIILPLLTILNACVSTSGVKDVVVEDRGDAPSKVDAIAYEKGDFGWRDLANSTSKKDNNRVETSTEIKAVAELKASNTQFTLYFAYDAVDISDSATQEIIKHANFMRNNPEIKLRLEGHADERGTREYNLALGENRAISVKEVLGLYTGLGSRIEVVSYGEEKPVAGGHDETSWKKNRRVEFIYR